MNDMFGFETAFPPGTLIVSEPAGRYRQARPREILDAARLAAEALLAKNRALTSADLVAEFLRARIGYLEHEVFAALYLDTRQRLIAYEELFRGTIASASVHPREVVKQVLAHNAAAVIFAHNHPSGRSEPSQADVRLTALLKNALEIIEVRVLDHVIVGGNEEYCSFAQRGLL